MSLPHQSMIRDWMEAVCADFAKKKPYLKPFPIDDFNGCSAMPDFMAGCCFVHDVSYHYSETQEERRRADRNFRDCIVAKGGYEYFPWGWFWRVLAWVAWAAVRVFGRGVVSRRKP